MASLLFRQPSVLVGTLALQLYGGKASAPLQILDAQGASANVGALQVQVDSGAFGTVSGMNLAAADVACRELGYEYGVLAMSPCGAYGAANLCGAIDSPVAMQDLVCSGGEMSVTECSWVTPSNAVHDQDSVIYCGSSTGTVEGSVRLLSTDGAPSLSADGIVEIFLSGSWSPVCGISSGAESLVCKALGFMGTASGAVESGHGFSAPRIGGLTCSGTEGSVLECSFESGDDVYCAPSEASIVHCA